MEPQHSFGVWLKRRRKGLDLTQAELAQQLDCSVAAVRKFESEERRPSAQIVDRLATIFDIPSDERTTFLRFARGDWYFSPAAIQEEYPWRASANPSPDSPSSDQQGSAFKPHRTNLPAHLTSFIGRESEAAVVQRLLSESRLVTVTGAGGSGKTRLALRVAGNMLDSFEDGVWLVELAPLADPALVPSAIAVVLGMIEDKNRPVLDALADFLFDRHALLLLDNCEHLVEAAAQLTNTLLSRCPNLCILTTSREPLRIVGETVWLAPTLSLPSLGAQIAVDDLAQYDAITLFTERATAVLPTFSLTEENATAVMELCQRLDGLPLAIELAAARVKLLRVEQVVARLDSSLSLLSGGSRTAPPRHQTLKALIDWSYDLLSPIEQRLLRRLSVFAGGFSLEAAETVCNMEQEGDVLESLSQLVTKSLVTASRDPGQETRYTLHETIRQYAWAELEAVGEAKAIQERHAEYYCLRLEALLPRFHYDDRAFIHFNWLETEAENLRALMGRSLADDAVSLEWGIRVVTRLAGFWYLQSRMVEGRRWLDAAVRQAAGATPGTRAALFVREADFKNREGDPQGLALAVEALALFQQLEDNEGIIRATVIASLANPDLEQAKSDLEQCLISAAELSSEALAGVNFGMMWVAGQAGDFQLAIKHGEVALKLRLEQGSQINLADMMRTLGDIYSGVGHYERATTLLLEAQTLAHSLNAKGVLFDTFHSLGWSAYLQKDFELANAYYRDAQAIADEIGGPTHSAFNLSDMGFCFMAQGELGQATAVFRESTNILRVEHRVTDTLISNVWKLAQLAELSGELVRAGRLQGAAGMLGVNTSFGLTPAELEAIDRNIAYVRAKLGEEAYSVATAEGRAMSLDEAIAYALEE